VSSLTLVDLSSNNHEPGNQPIDWPTVKATGGVQAVIVKATQGSSYINPWLELDLGGAASVGLPAICYHYAGFGDVASELRFFLNVAGAGRARALDFETDTDVAWIEAFCAGLRAPALGYGSVGTYPNLAASIRRWIAAPSWKSPPPDCDLWQFSSSSPVAGIPSATVDRNLWVGDTFDYEALFEPIPSTPSSLLLTGGPP